jgi:hypothetical protein
MGSGTFDAGAYRAFTSSTTNKTTDEIYSSRSLNKTLDPKGVKVRESRDSVDNPLSTPVIVALDVTGSMGMIADVIARQSLGTLFTSILDRKPITNPHVMFMGIGDAFYDSAPLQVSQFEADKSIIEQLTQLYLEHGGGGNNFESYNLAWYFAANHTVHDSYEKRAKRGSSLPSVMRRLPKRSPATRFPASAATQLRRTFRRKNPSNSPSVSMTFFTSSSKKAATHDHILIA